MAELSIEASTDTFAITTSRENTQPWARGPRPSCSSREPLCHDTHAVVASLRPQPYGLPLRGRATQSDDRKVECKLTDRNTKPGPTDSTLIFPVRGLEMGGGARIDVVVQLAAQQVTLIAQTLAEHRSEHNGRSRTGLANAFRSIQRMLEANEASEP